jgi:hypothetical protein
VLSTSFSLSVVLLLLPLPTPALLVLVLLLEEVVVGAVPVLSLRSRARPRTMGVRSVDLRRLERGTTPFTGESLRRPFRSSPPLTSPSEPPPPPSDLRIWYGSPSLPVLRCSADGIMTDTVCDGCLRDLGSLANSPPPSESDADVVE